jgi:hypothetical protein
MNSGRITKVIVPILCLILHTAPIAAQPTTKGERPPALAPYAENDPVPKLALKPYPDQNTPRRAVESFLAYLSTGLNMTTTSVSTLFGLKNGYEMAWSLMTDPKPSLEQFKSQWANTARLGSIQVEPIDDQEYFVELERLDLVGDRWVSSFYFGTIATTKTDAG